MIDYCLTLLDETKDTEETLDILRFHGLDLGFRLGHILQLLCYLEKIGVPENSPCESVRLSREVAAVIERFCGPILEGEEPTRPVYSRLMGLTDDPFVSRALCHLIWVYLKNCTWEEASLIMKSELSTGITVLGRLLELLHHPSQPLRTIVIGILLQIVTQDEDKEFSLIARRLVREGRDLIIIPRPELKAHVGAHSLVDLFSAVAREYSDHLCFAIESGLVAEMVSLLDSYIEIPQLHHWYKMSIITIVYFLFVVVNQSSQDQVSPVMTKLYDRSPTRFNN
eukprot:Protomagalhaensia_wolfi_Nauph_80__706@NODE_1400_length_1545_cov_118_949535_g1084_i0_p1_GENE_NODE_1400_length_1545_cov_118_949535_g1084_i0NODE_1400_length_1545_cov_118_949535_g1084_i0_p1_ORF_typecomplete_len282_score24_40_NODE_1400_length_1545_cov_118_949535_g1084_i02431088